MTSCTVPDFFFAFGFSPVPNRLLEAVRLAEDLVALLDHLALDVDHLAVRLPHGRLALERRERHSAAAEHLRVLLRQQLVLHRRLVLDLRAVLLQPVLETAAAATVTALRLAEELLPLDEDRAELDGLLDKGIGLVGEDAVLLGDFARLADVDGLDNGGAG